MPFDPLSQPPPDLDADIVDRPIGGLGVHLVRDLADESPMSATIRHNVLHVVLLRPSLTRDPDRSLAVPP